METHLYYLGECLLRKGHSVVVLTHAYGKRRGVRFLSNGLKVGAASCVKRCAQVYYLPIIVVGVTSLPAAAASLCWYRRVLLRERTQIVHGHSVRLSLYAPLLIRSPSP